ncbi:MAG: TAXI family TRAP transporter solute-binding subunit [Firmicutes bacterium]|nr:TAXI family TRAP transporter solute-binding subunit [Bacillota bacterium]
MALRKTISLRLGVLALGVALLLAAATPAVFAYSFPFVTIGTASPAGAYYPIGVAMADIWNRSIPRVRFSARETGGGVANLNLLAGGEIEVGIANENIAYDALKGHAPFNRSIDLVGGWVMNQSMGVFVALRDSGLRSVEDLRGRRISLGSPGSSANVLGQLILEAHGLTPDEYNVVYLGWQESADALNDGLIDAAFMVGGQPFPAIESLALRNPITLLSFDGDRFRAVSSYPYATGTIPAEMYDLEEDGDAVIVRSIIYLRPDLPEDLVYEMMKQVFANIPALKAAHPSGDQAAVLSQAEAEAIELPMHPGAIRYANEVGEW